ncbi:MAG: GNAT family N-acetyltransferase [Candidatus Howiella sp.]|jgi:GNAT superfamily N-acetyltransferase
MPDLFMRPICTAEEFASLSRFAADIWREHFSPLLPPGQTEYMIEKFQSAAAMERQTAEEGYRYYQMEADGLQVGYFAIKPDGSRLFLSKLYVEKSNRGKGYSSAALNFIKRHCKENGFSAVWLTVNRHNAGPIAVYRHFGFRVIEEKVTDIGGGYVMDDYFMELLVE